ncbi:MAG: STAS domain-containing protein [Clostridiales bacterium]|nr:STAS domain-containing protein [Clostridiales bacterium]
MSIICRTEGGRSCWKLAGEIDHHRARSLTRELEAEIDARLPAALELDFSGVTFMDSSGIALILRANRRMGEIGGSLKLTHVPPQAARILKIAGIHRRVEME